MKETYTVARNPFTVSAPDSLSAWRRLRPRFLPFLSDGTEKPLLEIDITPGTLPECDGETIYEPEHSGIGPIASRTLRLPDGSLVLEFRHVEESLPRLLMKMSPDFGRADITIDRDGAPDASYFLTHAMMLAYMLAASRTGTLLIHASSVILDGRAYLFQGKSGTGKSTHAALWTDNIPGAELLNDDNPVIRPDADGRGVAYGSPWSGKTHCYRNLAAPVGAFVRIVRAKKNELRRLPPLNAYASLSASVFYLPFMEKELRDIRHSVIERLAQATACCEMHCLPDADAALTCMKGVTASSMYGHAFGM